MNEHQVPRKDRRMDTKEATELGVKLFAAIETSIANAIDQLLELRVVYTDAYVNGDLLGTDALNERDECVELAGALASLKADVTAKHVRGTVFAQAAGTDIVAPYAELPPRKGPVPRSGGR